MEILKFEEVEYLERDTNHPVFSGEVPSEIGKGGLMFITIGNKTYTTEINPATGKWSWEPPELIEDGNYNMAFQTMDKAGNPSIPTLRTLIVDTTPPLVPELILMYDDQGQETGMLKSGDITDDRRPTLTGFAQKNTIVYLKDGDRIIGSTKVDDNGVWTLEPMEDLSNGKHNLTLQAKELFAKKERISEISTPFELIIEGNPVSSPIISGITDNVGTLQGAIDNGGVTDDQHPTVNGTAEPGNIITLYIDGKGVGSTRADANGLWSITTASSLLDGVHNIHAVASNDEGENSEASSDWNILVDTIISKPVINSVYDDAGQNHGNISNGGKTDDVRPTLSGTAEKGSVVVIYDGQNVVGSVISDINNNWIFTPSIDLKNGEHQFHVIATDEAGNISQPSDKWSVNVTPDTIIKTLNEDFESKSEGTVAIGTHFNGFKLISDSGFGTPHISTLYGSKTLTLNRSYSNDNGWTASRTKFEFDNEVTEFSMDVLSVNGANAVVVRYLDAAGKVLYSEYFSGPNIGTSYNTSRYSGAPVKFFEVEAIRENGGICLDNIKMTAAIPANDIHVNNQILDFDDSIVNLAGEFISEKIDADFSHNEVRQFDLRVNIDDVLTRGTVSKFIDDGKNQVLISGNETQKIELSNLLKDGTDLNDWTKAAGTITIAGEQYKVYQHSGNVDTEVIVQQGIIVELNNY